MTIQERDRPRPRVPHVRNAARDTINRTRLDGALTLILCDLDRKLQDAHRLVNATDKDRARDVALEWAYNEIMEGIRITFNVK